MKERIKFIDIAKAMAIIIIVFGHTIVRSHHCSSIFSFLYQFNVALFFILSGYTFNIKRNFKQFIKNKFLRIMVPYFVWAVIFIIPYILLGNKVGDSLGTKQSFDLLTIIKNTLYGNGVNNSLRQNTSLWFLPALFSMECIYYFIIKVGKEKYDLIKLILLFVIGVLSTKLLTIYLPWGINSVLQIGAGTFYIGYLLSKYNVLEKVFKPLYMIIFLTIGSFVCIINTSVNYVDYNYGNYFLTIIAGILMSVVIIYISSLVNKNRTLEYIGRNTLGILIFHKIIVLVFQTKLGIISKSLRNSNLPVELLITAIIVVLSIACSLIITEIIKKIIPILVGEFKNDKKIANTKK